MRHILLVIILTAALFLSSCTERRIEYCSCHFNINEEIEHHLHDRKPMGYSFTLTNHYVVFRSKQSMKYQKQSNFLILEEKGSIDLEEYYICKPLTQEQTDAIEKYIKINNGQELLDSNTASTSFADKYLLEEIIKSNCE